MNDSDAPLRIASISMVRDECDIIELFVKINSRMVDHMFVLDHGSRDPTADILKALRDAGYPLTIYPHEPTISKQARIMTTLARQVVAVGGYDYIVPLDADEFIHCPQGSLHDALATEMPAAGCGLLRLLSYVPLRADYFASPAPLNEHFRMRSREPDPYFKVVMTNALAAHAVLAPGNHHVLVEGARVAAPVLTPVLQHCPIRSREQALAKALINSRRVSLKSDRTVNESFHWDLMANFMRHKGLAFDDADLAQVALRYMWREGEQADDVVPDESAPRIGTEDDIIAYRHWAKVDLVARLDQFAGELCDVLRGGEKLI